jgi:transposase-like protein
MADEHLGAESSAATGDARAVHDEISGSRTPGSRTRRRLTEGQLLEVVRLHSETDTTAASIARTLGISQASVYRVLHSQGSARRGRTGQRPPQVSARARRRTSRTEQTSDLPRRGRRRRPAEDAGLSAGGRPRRVQTSSTVRRRFRVTFVADIEVEAENVSDAIGQAEARGATEVTIVELAR